MPDEHTHDEPTGPTSPPADVDPLVQQLLEMMAASWEARAKQTDHQLDGMRMILKWNVGLTVICLVTIVSLAGASIAVKTGVLDVSTSGTIAQPPPHPFVGPLAADTGFRRPGYSEESDAIEGPP